MYKFTLLLICFVGLVWSETCPSGQVSDCIHTSCASGSDLTCMDGLCSCTSTGPQKCISRDDCLAITNWNCREQDRHCIDNMCQCIRLP
uniref:Serine protease inhibitor Cvsi-1-like n=1 Tax=Crassostrea virginica TaxID=6565 RepID=A0A8B8AG99_CRAVI|nr:serine protease inhibitor Cvsi-1-like [Crassostrea virginica]XP_022330991.1 serine protease inhibitor Cvsi-1-like [Crassostrea virginica]